MRTAIMKRMSLLAAVTPVLIGALAIAQEAGEPIPFAKLVSFLPEKVSSFIADKADGSTTAAMGFKLTTVSRTYHQGEEGSDKTISLRITDGTGNQFFAAAHAVAPEFSHQSIDGYEKGFKLDGYPALEKYDNHEQVGSLTVFVSNRFLIEIETSGLDSKTLQEWWKKLDIEKLEGMKAS